MTMNNRWDVKPSYYKVAGAIAMQPYKNWNSELVPTLIINQFVHLFINDVLLVNLLTNKILQLFVNVNR